MSRSYGVSMSCSLIMGMGHTDAGGVQGEKPCDRHLEEQHMCGIAGYWGQLPAGSAAALVHNMNAALAYRGPDGEGMWLGSNVGFGHRRLAIIDVTDGAQPMASADGRYHIVFNGEIYNYRELRQHLMSVGYPF